MKPRYTRKFSLVEVENHMLFRLYFAGPFMGPLNSNIGSQSDKINVNFLKHGSEMLDQQISQLPGLENIDSISNSKKGCQSWFETP